MSHTTSYGLPVTIFREGKQFIAYSPALDLSSAGSTEKEAKRMFAEAVEVFFEELIEMGTLTTVLKDLGWTRAQGKFQPPKVVDQSIMKVLVPSVAQGHMGDFGNVGWKKFGNFLISQGCTLQRIKGDHLAYVKFGLKRPLIVPQYTPLPPFIILNNLRVLGANKEDLLKFLKR